MIFLPLRATGPIHVTDFISLTMCMLLENVIILRDVFIAGSILSTVKPRFTVVFGGKEISAVNRGPR